MGGLGGLNKANSTIAHVAGGLVGIVSFINTSSSKFGRGLNLTQKAVYTASQVLGPELTWALIGGTGKTVVTINGQSFGPDLPAQSINPWGALNGTTFGGIALLIVGWVLDEFLDGKYGINHALPWFRSIGAGLTFGGIVGGVFDPSTPGIRAGGTGLFAPRSSIGYGAAPSTGFSPGATPFAPAGGY